MNKRYFFNLLKTLLLLLTVSGASGCNDWLDVRPENEQPIDEFWNNKEEVDAVMMGAYQQLRSSLEYLVRWGELRGDVVELGPGLTSNENMLAVKGLDIKSDNPICKWQPFYNAIGRCNAVIRYAADVLPRDKTFTDGLAKRISPRRSGCGRSAISTWSAPSGTCPISPNPI